MQLYKGGYILYFRISHHVRSMEWRLRRVVPAAAITTHPKPHAQQQLARDLEVERAVMMQRCRPQISGPGLLCEGAYTQFPFFILSLMIYTDVSLFSLSGILFPREYTIPDLNETVKHDKIREKPENRALLYTLMFARAFGIFCC